MKRSILVLLACILTAPAGAQRPDLREDDRIRLAEAFRLASGVQDAIWTGWSDIPFAVLLVTADHEFLVRHPRPSEDFVLITAFDSLLESSVYARPRQFSPGLLATFPAVGGVPTVVVGQPEQTGKTSTFWVITLLHEHFHQLQTSQQDYWAAVAGLELSGGDETGMWMLNYPFPYASESVDEHFSLYREALQTALAVAPEQKPASVQSFVEAKDALRASLDEADYRYFSFQLWQEGVARYTEFRVAEHAAGEYEPLSSFSALGDFVPYRVAADSLRQTLDQELRDLELGTWHRVSFYPVGAAEALLLDAVQPGWHRLYLTDRFYLERYFDTSPREP